MRTFEEISRAWVKEKKHYVKKSTISVYEMLLENHLMPRFRNSTQIDEREAQDFVLDKLEEGLSQKTVKDIMILLKMILKYGAKYCETTYTPFDIRFPTLHEKIEIEVMSKRNQKMLMNYLEERFSFKNLGILICLNTGMRIGEVCALKWSDLDFENKLIHINRTIQRVYVVNRLGKNYTEIVIDSPKTKNSIRKIPMSKLLQRLLKPFIKIVNPEFFVLTNTEKHTEPRTYRTYFRRLFEELDLPPMKFHGLRHTFATRCIESKADLKTIATILGHSNISTTMNLYVHPTDEERHKAVEQMLKAL